jgi:hypothetical protein
LNKCYSSERINNDLVSNSVREETFNWCSYREYTRTLRWKQYRQLRTGIRYM